MRAVVDSLSIMHFFVYFNTSEAVSDGTWPIYAAITVAEAAGIFFSYFYLLFVVYLLFKSGALHINLRVIWGMLGCEYFTQLTARSVEIYFMFSGGPVSIGFLAASYVRCTTYFVVSLLLPALIAERACATYFLEDYEKKRRLWISMSILILNIVPSITMSYFFHQVSSTMGLHIAMLVVNLVASAGLHLLDGHNRKKHKRYEGKMGLPKYILSEKYQIAENLKTFEILKTMVNAVTVLNLVSTVLLALDNYNFSTSTANLIVTVFNITILIYGTTGITVMFVCNKPWLKLAKQIFSRVKRPSAVTEQLAPPTDHQGETQQYFDQLAADWENRFHQARRIR